MNREEAKQFVCDLCRGSSGTKLGEGTTEKVSEIYRMCGGTSTHEGRYWR